MLNVGQGPPLRIKHCPSERHQSAARGGQVLRDLTLLRCVSVPVARRLVV